MAGVMDWIDAEIRVLQESRADALVSTIDAAVIDEVPDLGTNSELRQALRLSSVAALELMPDLFARGSNPRALEAGSGMVELGRAIAERGRPLTLLLRAYRVGLRVVWAELMDRVNTSTLNSQERADALQFLWDRLSRGLEAITEQVVAAHLDVHHQLLRGALADRRECVEAILSGTYDDPDQATALLAHHVGLHQTALVLWTSDRSRRGNVDALERAAGLVAGWLGAPPPLTLQISSSRLWAWIATARQPSLDTLVEQSSELNPGVRLAVGAPLRGLHGFRRSHETALRAAEVSELVGDTTIVLHRDVELAGLVIRDESGARELIRRELGPLASGDAVAGRLRQTLRVYLDTGSSARAAEQLGVHKNTVLYRLRQVEDALGRHPDGLGVSARVALSVLEVLGTAWINVENRQRR